MKSSHFASMADSLIDLNLDAGMKGRALVKRIKFGKLLAVKIKEAKKQRQIIARMGLSTGTIDLGLKVLRTNYIDNAQMVKHLKGHYQEACFQRDKIESAVKFVEKHSEKELCQ